jgi:Predicted transcription factor, homolog of eukaryotic MBF1
MNIAEKIKSARTAKGLTQKELGTALNISDKAVSKWERGVAMPDIGTIPKLCKVLGISTNDLLSEEQPEEAKPAPKRKRFFVLIPAIVAVIIAATLAIIVANSLIYDENSYKNDPLYLSIIANCTQSEAETIFRFSSEKYDYATKTTTNKKSKIIKYTDFFPLLDGTLVNPEPLGDRKITAEYCLAFNGIVDFWHEIDGEIYRSNRNKSLVGFEYLEYIEFYKLSPLNKKIFRYLTKS